MPELRCSGPLAHNHNQGRLLLSLIIRCVLLRLLSKTHQDRLLLSLIIRCVLLRLLSKTHQDRLLLNLIIRCVLLRLLITRIAVSLCHMTFISRLRVICYCTSCLGLARTISFIYIYTYTPDIYTIHHIYIHTVYIYGVYMVFLAGKLRNVQSYTLYIYGCGQP